MVARNGKQLKDRFDITKSGQEILLGITLGKKFELIKYTPSFVLRKVTEERPPQWDNAVHNMNYEYLAHSLVLTMSKSRDRGRRVTKFTYWEQSEGPKIGLKFRMNKCSIKKLQYFRRKISLKDLSPWPSKVEVIRQLSPPPDKEELQNLIIFVTFMSSFIKKFVKMDVPFVWASDVPKDFEEIKRVWLQLLH
ncbi:unnamed protein product [Lepeophtheirus salmonis]|uniref:(salmon louse) hypothetical protein n=1 Tax=Lepeophtheirus salmonis TaxID=72036 RepID=A0A7R8H1U6_LEPSM|nr:unnamed protein product [Lepeophtheirus salmonis]CAF2817958.1 unnamed protein product [Lepeophtheirus salmonis]